MCAWGWWGHPSPWGASLRAGFSRDFFVCPICHYPKSIPGNVPKGHGPTGGHCLVQTLESPTPAVPISVPLVLLVTLLCPLHPPQCPRGSRLVPAPLWR